MTDRPRPPWHPYPLYRRIFPGNGSRLETNVLLTTVMSALVMGSGLLTSVVLARMLGPDGRGAIAAAMLWPSLLSYLGSLGIATAAIYYTSIPEAEPETVLANSLAFSAVQSMVTMSLGYLALPYLLSNQDQGVVRMARLCLIMIPTGLLSQYCSGILQGMRLFSLFNRLRAITPLGYLGGTILLMMSGSLSVINVLILTLVLNITSALACLAALAFSGIKIGSRVDLALAGRMAHYGLRVQLGDVSVLGNTRLDQVFLAAWFSPAELGLYVAAVSASSPVEVFSNAVKTVITPELAKATSADERTEMLENVLRKYWSFTIPGVICLALALPILIPILFGPDFRSAVLPAEVLVLALIFSGGKEILTGVARALGKPGIPSRAEIVGMVVSVGSLAALLPTLGIMGAAVASLLSYAATFCVVILGLIHSENVKMKSLFPFFARP